MSLTDLRDLRRDEIAAFLAAQGEPDFRARQVCQWVYRRQATSVQQMTDLSEALRQRLQKQTYVSTLSLLQRQRSEDGTEKLLFGVEDGNRIETVLIPRGDKRTICVSTQVGCALGCGFCLTAQGGLVRSLRPAEIVGQVLHFQEPGREPARDFTNIVFMGMGEPLDNFRGNRAGGAHSDGRLGAGHFAAPDYRLDVGSGPTPGGVRARGPEGESRRLPQRHHRRGTQPHHAHQQGLSHRQAVAGVP